MLFPTLVCWGQQRAAVFLLVGHATVHLLVLLLLLCSLLLCLGPEPQSVACKRNEDLLILHEVNKLKETFFSSGQCVREL